MKTAVWCSTGRRTIRKDTDAEYLPELSRSTFVYMDDQIKKQDETHISLDVLTTKLDPEVIPNVHSFDAIVLENCPINLYQYKQSNEKKHTLLYNCMLLLKNQGKLFVRSPSTIKGYGPFEEHKILNSTLGLFQYIGPSKNPKYMIFKFQAIHEEIPRRTSSGISQQTSPETNKRTTVKELQTICKENHLRYTSLRKAELTELLKKMNLM